MVEHRPDLTGLHPGLTEAVFQSRVVGLCRALGLKWHHETDSRRTRAGYPDLTIVAAERARPAPGRGVVVAELKTQTGRVSPEQREWLERFRHAGVDAYLWRPSDWSEINRRLHELGGRPVPREYRTHPPSAGGS